MCITAIRRHFAGAWLAIGLLTSSHPLLASATDDLIVATIGDQAISLRDIDDAGGHPVYEKAQALYEVRVQALYALLSDRLLKREAEARGIPLAALRQTEIADKVAEIADTDIDRFLAQQPKLNAEDSRVRRRVSLFLRMQAQADRKSQFMQTLFDKYSVSVSLAGPPSPPAEAIVGDIAPALGSPNAPVTIVSFSDYKCIHCRKMSNTLFQLHEQFPDAVQIVYRHFPLHADAQPLAEAALCAGDQNRFWEYHNLLFAAPTIDKGDTQRIADQLGLDSTAFNACLSSRHHRARVLADIQEGRRLKISATPTSFINGIRLTGATNLQTLIARVQQQLAAERLPAAAANAGLRSVAAGKTLKRERR